MISIHLESCILVGIYIGEAGVVAEPGKKTQIPDTTESTKQRYRIQVVHNKSLPFFLLLLLFRVRPSDTVRLLPFTSTFDDRILERGGGIAHGKNCIWASKW